MRELSRWAAPAAGAVRPALVTPLGQAAEDAIRSAATAEAIPNGYPVQPKDFSTASANSLAARFGGRVERIFSTASNGFSAALSERAAKRLAAEPAVECVKQHLVVRAPWATPAAAPRWRPRTWSAWWPATSGPPSTA
ncbi:hypothetical protein FHS29_006066 [Saccharothrix tamanrassetensis]|uniref:Inhibitor I9 domain-containing protein n=1 Tax=Saccharothrix tamanrassetensis TaxID=1051531 RepID=A0A841CU17_9PSEU|nr:protease inhibitor I9 family protein [Saccharothrix tamanrassetensis]MBB5959445.1 hypothetical protein [Saccharothrix tamanrassetensis]